ncbi:hypothetical protein [Candidatus Solirubrobacter pratensis]|uniref:hypothetical protein n=1 Tax=Candidatus Solirubrobacter pratensis TaxID=1298857 RepID=UPI0004811C81|nr:hypothetical protein [Candidatus Solirubrobacter pratensis]
MPEWKYDGRNGSIAKGYAVRWARTTPETNGGNAVLINQSGDHIGLWVTDVTADFEMAGTTAQSARKRDFYPHNFVQPHLNVKGQSGDSYQYQRIAEFVRDSHLKSILYSDHDNVTTPTVTLTVLGRGFDAARNMRGSTQTIIVDGYIESIQRGAQKAQFSPEWEFDFIVSKARSWLMTDEKVKGRKLKNILDFITKGSADSLATDVNGPRFEDDPDPPDATLGAINEALASYGSDLFPKVG